MPASSAYFFSRAACAFVSVRVIISVLLPVGFLPAHHPNCFCSCQYSIPMGLISSMNFSGKKRRAIFRRFTAILFDALASCDNRLKLPFRLPVRVPFKQKTGEIPLYFPLFHCKAAPIALSSSYMIEEAPEILPISTETLSRKLTASTRTGTKQNSTSPKKSMGSSSGRPYISQESRRL